MTSTADIIRDWICLHGLEIDGRSIYHINGYSRDMSHGPLYVTGRSINLYETVY